MSTDERMPEHLRPIWDIICEYDVYLTDGFVHYGEYSNWINMCQKIYDQTVGDEEPGPCVHAVLSPVGEDAVVCNLCGKRWSQNYSDQEGILREEK